MNSSSPMLASREQTDLPYRAVAPAWHTVAVLFILLGLSLVGALGGTRMLDNVHHGRIVSYLMVMLIEWVTVAFIMYGLLSRGLRIPDIVGGSWPRPKDILRDLGIALGFLVVSTAILSGLGYLLKTSTPESVRKGLPHGPTEIVLWLLLSLTAGFCEEVIFRGYLQRQFQALTHSTAAAIVMQGLVFGLAHGYQGWKLILVISLFGTMFGVLAWWRRSLRPGMLAHFLQDGVGGILGS